MKNNIIGKIIKFTVETDSTNLWAKRRCDMPDGTVFVSKKQTMGRGRRGRNWISDDGGLWLSILMKPDILPSSLSVLTLIAGMAVRDAIGENSAIKWPNDVIMSSKKVCGILTEGFKDADGSSCVVCGVGINLNQESFDDEIRNIATSLKIELGCDTDKFAFLEKLIACFNRYYEIFLEKGFLALKEEYKKYCITLGKTVEISDINGVYTAEAVDITDSGELTVKLGTEYRNICSGEVSVRGLLGYV